MPHLARFAVVSAAAFFAQSGAALAEIAIDFSIRIDTNPAVEKTVTLEVGEETSVRIDDVYRILLLPTMTEEGFVSIAAKVMKGDEVKASPRVAMLSGAKATVKQGSEDSDGNLVEGVAITLTPTVIAAL